MSTHINGIILRLLVFSFFFGLFCLFSFQSAEAQTYQIFKDLSTSGNLSVGNRIIVSNDHIKYQGGSGSTGGIPVKTEVLGPLILQKDITIVEPNLIQGVMDEVPMFSVDSYNFPNGITITAIYLSTSADSSLAVNLEEWTEPDGSGTETTIDNIATAGSDEQTETTISDPNVAAGTTIFLDLDSTDVNWLHLTVWFYVNN